MNCKTNSSDNEKCTGCKHITNNLMGFCYMFSDKPEVLPCGQHDKYAEQRKANGKKLYENMKAKKEPVYENTAADDYLEYLHDQW